MKILQINKFFYKRGGAEAYMFSLSQLLKEAGHQVIEFSMQDEKNNKSDYNQYFIKNIDFQKREGLFKDLKKVFHALYSFEAKNKLEVLIKAEKPDIAHIHNFNIQLTPSILSVLKKYNIPVVWTMHDYKLICPNFRLFTKGTICERCKYYKYYNCFINNCFNESRAMSFLAMLEMYLHKIILNSYEKINLYISPSKFLKNKVEEWNIKPAKTKHIFNFINISEFDGSYKQGNGLVYFGRLSQEKGIKTLLEAMKQLPAINLSIIGTGPQEDAIKEFISNNNLNNVKLLGYKSGSELYGLIKDSRLVILPSVWYENNSIAILEAFAMAKPVIASDLGGNSELVQNGKTGFLFTAGNVADLKNKISINYNISELENMGKNARQFVEQNCSPEVHLKQILEVYQNLVIKK